MALIGQAVLEEKIFEIVDGRKTDGRTPDHGHPISSPSEPNGSGELINGINVAETVDIVQLSAIALQISRQMFDCNAGINTHLLRLLCAKTTFHRLTLLCGIADVTNAAK